MTVTTLPTLQPLNLAELLDRALRLYRKNFLTLTGVIALVQIPIVFLQILASLLTFGGTVSQLGQPISPRDPFSIFTPQYFLGQIAIYTLALISYFVISLARAAIVKVTADNYLSGESVTVLAAYRKIMPTLPRLMLTLVFLLVVAAIVFIWLIVPCVGWFTGVGMFVYGSWVLYPLVVVCCVLEGQGAFGSLRRAWDLARRRFWWTIGFMFLMFVFGIAVTLGPSVVIGGLLGVVLRADIFSNNPSTVFTLQTILQSVTTMAISILYMPIQVVSEALLYFDLRVRTEGFDLALQTAGSTPPADLLAQAPQPEKGHAITGKEFGYFFLLSLGTVLPVIVLYVVFIGIILAAVGLARPF